jgi:hypothetical protein
MKLFIIEIPKFINGEVLALKGLIASSSMVDFERRYGLVLSSSSSASYTINSDGPDGFIFQSMQIELIHNKPRISYSPIFPQGNFFHDLSQNYKVKNINLFVENNSHVENYIYKVLLCRLQEKFAEMPNFTVLDFIKDMLDLADKSKIKRKISHPIQSRI